MQRLAFKIVFIILCLGGCGHFYALIGIGHQQPTVKIEKVEFRGLTMKALKLDLKLKIFNPNKYKLEFSRTAYNVSVGGKEFAKGHYSPKMTAEGEGYSFITIPIKVNLQTTEAVLRRILLTGEKPVAKWTIEADFHGPIGPMRVNYNSTKPLY